MSLKLVPIGVEWDGAVFRPSDPYSAELADKLPRGVKLESNFTVLTSKAEGRAAKLRLWWAGMNLLQENTEEFPTSRKLHEHILEELGFYKKMPRADDADYREVDSIKAENMEDAEFDTLFELARTYVLTRWHFDPWERWKEEAAEHELERARARRALHQ
jgi:hypothetical protein